MAYRLNPEYPQLWRNPHTLQIGYDRAVVVLADLADGYWYLLEALRHGIGLSGLTLLATEHHISDTELRHFLEQLAPALLGGEALSTLAEEALPELLSEPVPNPALRLQFDGVAEIIDQLARKLNQPHPVRSAQAPQLTVLCERYLIPPALWQPHIHAGQPHLPVVFGDQSVTIGPLVIPGKSACLYCTYLWQAEEQPWLATLYSQTRSHRQNYESSLPSERGPLFWIAIAELSWLLDSYRSGFPAAAESVQFYTNGEVTRKTWQRHPDCYCAEDFAQSAMVA